MFGKSLPQERSKQPFVQKGVTWVIAGTGEAQFLKPFQ